jgi:hypothetical protein
MRPGWSSPETLSRTIPLAKSTAPSAVERPEPGARVKLTSWLDAVKPERTELVTAGVAALVAAVGLLVVWTALDPEKARMDRVGTSSARIFAELCIEPLLKQDRLHLAAIASRLVDLEEISRVAVYTVDQQVLVMAGAIAGPEYQETVAIDDNIIGYARIALNADAFHSGPAGAVASWLAAGYALLVVMIAALGTALARSVTRGIRSGRLALELPTAGDVAARLRERVLRPPPEAPPVEEPATDEDEPPRAVNHYLLAVNLYNQFSLQPVEREFELSLCTELAEAVASLYQGQVVSLPGLGALVDFDDTDSGDRAFEVISAAYVLARLLRDEAPFGTYRLGLHRVARAGDEPLPLDHPAVGDAALLSALARDGTLALSAPLVAAIGNAEHLTLLPMKNVLLEELVTSSAECQSVTDLAPAERTRLLQQVETLKTQRDSIASESTF